MSLILLGVVYSWWNDRFADGTADGLGCLHDYNEALLLYHEANGDGVISEYLFLIVEGEFFTVHTYSTQVAVSLIKSNTNE